MKHAYSKDNYACISAIIPAFFNYIGTNLLKPGMKLADKKTLIEERIDHFSEMFTSFI
jgi:hypothetical protein